MKIIEKTGIDAIGIHGRTKDQRPNHANNTDAIRFIIFRKFRKKREIVDIYLKIFYSFYFCYFTCKHFPFVHLKTIKFNVWFFCWNFLITKINFIFFNLFINLYLSIYIFWSFDVSKLKSYTSQLATLSRIIAENTSLTVIANGGSSNNRNSAENTYKGEEKVL